MGLSDFIDNMRYGGWKTALKEIRDITRESKEELGEILTDGFREIVVNGNSNYRTSMEIKKDADRLLDEASTDYHESYQNYVKELSDTETAVAEYETFTRAKMDDVFTKWFKISEKIDSEETRKTIQRLETEYKYLTFEFIEGGLMNTSFGEPLLTKFSSPEYKKPVPKLTIKKWHDSLIHCIPAPIEFEYGVSRQDRVNAAHEYEDAVKKYEETAVHEIDRHTTAISRMHRLKSQLEFRKKLLANFSDDMSQIINECGEIITREKIEYSTLILASVVALSSLSLTEDSQADSNLNGLLDEIDRINKMLNNRGK